MAEPLVYSQEATVRAITSFYVFIKGIHSSAVGDILYPPPTGWPQITHVQSNSTGETYAATELLRNIPYFCPEEMDTPCIMDLTQPIDYLTQWLPGSVEEAGPDKQDEKEVLYEDCYMIMPLYMVRLAKCRRGGYDILIDTKRGVVIWWNKDCRWQEDDHPGDVEPYGGDDIDECFSPEAWKVMPTFRVETFFEMCKERFSTLRWVPILEEFGRGAVVQILPQYATEDQLKRIQILKDAGWPGDGEGGGWDKVKAERETQEWQHSLSH